MRDLRRLSHVQRWGIVPRLRQQNVAEHSFYVALYTDRICGILGLDDATRLAAIRYALEHDAAEAFTGDLPSPMKAHVAGLDELEARVRRHVLGGDPAEPEESARTAVKVADLLDAVLYLNEESAMGNGRVSYLLQELRGRLVIAARDLGDEVWRFVDDQLWDTTSGVRWYVGD